MSYGLTRPNAAIAVLNRIRGCDGSNKLTRHLHSSKLEAEAKVGVFLFEDAFLHFPLGCHQQPLTLLPLKRAKRRERRHIRSLPAFGKILPHSEKVH